MTTFAQFAQVCREVLMDGQPSAQFAQVCREVLMDGQPSAQFAQVAREVLMSDVPANVAVVPTRPKLGKSFTEDLAYIAFRRLYPIQVRYWPPARRVTQTSEPEHRPRARFLYPIQPSVVVVTVRPFIYVQT